MNRPWLAPSRRGVLLTNQPTSLTNLLHHQLRSSPCRDSAHDAAVGTASGSVTLGNYAHRLTVRSRRPPSQSVPVCDRSGTCEFLCRVCDARHFGRRRRAQPSRKSFSISSHRRAGRRCAVKITVWSISGFYFTEGLVVPVPLLVLQRSGDTHSRKMWRACHVPSA